MEDYYQSSKRWWRLVKERVGKNDIVASQVELL